MRNTLWMWILTSTAVVLIGSYGVSTYMARNPTIPPIVAQGTAAEEATEPQQVGNPLLSADKAKVSRWFPGHCFAEIYNKNPSFGGKLIPNCMHQVIQQIKNETGITLTEIDIRKPEVSAHFKKIYGNDDLWLH
jgi:hypothetical protein